MKNRFQFLSLILATLASNAFATTSQAERIVLAEQVVARIVPRIVAPLGETADVARVTNLYQEELYSRLQSNGTDFDHFVAYSEIRLKTIMRAACWKVMRFRVGDMRVRSTCEAAAETTYPIVFESLEGVRVLIRRNVTGSSFGPALVDECVSLGDNVDWSSHFTAEFGEDFDVSVSVQTATHAFYSGAANVEAAVTVDGIETVSENEEYSSISPMFVSATQPEIFERFVAEITPCQP